MSRNSWNRGQAPARSGGPASMPPNATAGQIAPANNGVSDSNVAPFVSKFNLIVPQSTPSGACWNGQEVSVDFIIDPSMGKALNMNLQFDVTCAATTDVSGASVGTFIASSASFVRRIDYMFSGSVIETVYAPSLLQEGLTFVTDQELIQQAKLWAVDISNEYPAPLEVNTTAGEVKRTFYLPLSGSVPGAQLFVAGLNGELRIRVYLAPTVVCTKNGYASGAGAAVSLNALNLWVEEAGLSAGAYNALLQQHDSGVNYRTVSRTVFQRTQPTLTADKPQADILNSFKNDSAALSVYLASADTDPGFFMERYPLKALQLLDSGGSTLTRILPAALVENIITPSLTPISSHFINSPDYTTYLFGHCSSLARVLQGKVLGGLKYSGSEQISITPAADSTNLVETVVSFDYLAMRVQNGDLRWAKTAGDVQPW
jgi:hypothetical protein